MHNIESELKRLNEEYGLIAYKEEYGYIFYGNITLNHKSNNISLKGKFLISITVFYDFPEKIPLVVDVSSSVSEKFHKNSSNELCLACNSEMYLNLKKIKDVSIVDFIEMYVIPYFYSYAYFEKYGKVPFGERKHGFEGIFEFYHEIFDSSINDKAILETLEYFGKGKYKGHHDCFCGSGKIMRKCHIDVVHVLINDIGKRMIFADFELIKSEIDFYINLSAKKKRTEQRKYYNEEKRKKRLDYYFKQKKDKFTPTYSKIPWR